MFGGNVIQGLIVPFGIPKEDFNRPSSLAVFSRGEAFDWKRTISARNYNRDGCGIGFPSDIKNDDADDSDEDLIPDQDGQQNELSIWSVDAPSMQNDTVPNNNDIIRLRYNFAEAAHYASVKVSSNIPWYWRASVENPAGEEIFKQKDDVNGDNEVKAGVAPTPLTPDLGATGTPDFTITDSEPLVARLGVNIKGTITGTNLNPDPNCPPIIYLIRTADTKVPNGKPPTPVDATITTVFRLDLTSVTASKIEGTFIIANRPALIPDPFVGDYEVKIFIKDKVITSPQKVRIAR